MNIAAAKSWLLVLCGTALLLLAVKVDGFPTVFTDTDDYYSQGVELWGQVKTHLLGIAPERDTRSAEDRAQAAIDAELGRTQMAGRSTAYSAFLYATESAGGLWLVSAAQATAAAWTILLTLRVAAPGAGARAYLLLMTALAAGSTLPHFAGFAMPDVLAGVTVLGVVLLALGWRSLTPVERGTAALLLGFTIVVHSSHLLLAVALLPAAVLLLRWLREPWPVIARRTGVIVALIVASVATNAIYGTVVQMQTGEPLRRQPFLMARVLADGPGRDYLRAACAQARPYTLCRFAHAPLDDSEDVLWSDLPTTGVFLLSDYRTRIALEDEELRFVIGTLRHDFAGQLRASLANWGEQLGLVGIDDVVRDPHYYMTDPYWSRTYLPDMIMGVAHCGRQGNLCRLRFTPDAPQRADGRAPRAVEAATFHAAVVLASLVVIAAVLALRRPGRPLLALALLVLVAVLLNAGITGILSGPFPRYQARLVWLVPMLAGMLVAATRRRAAHA